MACGCCQGYALICRVVTYGWLIVAVILSIIAANSCEFVTRDGATIGLFQYQAPSESECIRYDDIDEDFNIGWVFNWAVVCSILAPLLGFLVILLMLLDCCCDSGRCGKYMQVFLVVCCQLSQVCTFLIYASDACLTRRNAESDTLTYKGCKMGDGSIFSLVAFGLYMIAGFTLCCSPKPDPECCKKDDKGKDEKKSESAAAEEEKPKDGDDVVVAPVVVKEEDEEKEEEEEVEENANEENNGEDDDDENANDEDAVPNDEEAGDEKEAPAIVPVPVPVPVPRAGATPPPEDLSMEIEFDEEFGTSQIRHFE